LLKKNEAPEKQGRSDQGEMKGGRFSKKTTKEGYQEKNKEVYKFGQGVKQNLLINDHLFYLYYKGWELTDDKISIDNSLFIEIRAIAANKSCYKKYIYD